MMTDHEVSRAIELVIRCALFVSTVAVCALLYANRNANTTYFQTYQDPAHHILATRDAAHG